MFALADVISPGAALTKPTEAPNRPAAEASYIRREQELFHYGFPLASLYSDIAERVEHLRAC